jgi:hypothetical protein
MVAFLILNKNNTALILVPTIELNYQQFGIAKRQLYHKNYKDNHCNTVKPLTLSTFALDAPPLLLRLYSFSKKWLLLNRRVLSRS